MPRNAAGVFSLASAYNPVITDELITAIWANTTLSDMGQALSDSLDRNGRGGMLAPFRLSDGTEALPGLAFLNESNTGLARLAPGATQAGAVPIVQFYQPPRYSADPIAADDLVRLVFLQTNYARIDGVTFTGPPQWATPPTASAHLTNKDYVDELAFNTALPGVASQDIGAQIYVDPAGVAQWSQAPAEEQALLPLARQRVPDEAWASMASVLHAHHFPGFGAMPVDDTRKLFTRMAELHGPAHAHRANTARV